MVVGLLRSSKLMILLSARSLVCSKHFSESIKTAWYFGPNDGLC